MNPNDPQKERVAIYTTVARSMKIPANDIVLTLPKRLNVGNSQLEKGKCPGEDGCRSAAANTSDNPIIRVALPKSPGCGL